MPSSSVVRTFRLTRRAVWTLAFAALVLLAFGSAVATAQVVSQERIIVSGASGQLGNLTVQALLARGVAARNLILVSRTPETLAEFAKLGAVTRFGDFATPESLPAAYAGGTRMLLISIGGGAGPRVAAHTRAIDAAIAAGVKHIAYTSYLGISGGERTGLAADHYQTEEILKQRRVAWTMLRNSIYADGLVEQAAQLVAAGRAVVPPAESKIGYVTREDCAAAAAAVLSPPGHENKVYDITGPGLVGQRELAETAAAVTGRKIELVAPAADAPAARGLGGPALAVTSTHVRDLTGRPATGLRQLLEANRERLLRTR
jgi:NAD(P)H dehydrogenase (quinone)